jgi:hypothetical protein
VTTVAKEPAKSSEQQQAEKNLDDIKKEKEQKLIEAGDDEEKKKQIEDEYKEKIETAEKEVEKANSEALVKAGEESTGEDDGDDEGEATGDDSTEKIEYEEKDGKKTPINTATIWHRRAKERGKGSTKNFYNKDGISISEEEFKKRLSKYRELKRMNKSDSKESTDAKEAVTGMSKYQRFVYERYHKQSQFIDSFMQ